MRNISESVGHKPVPSLPILKNQGQSNLQYTYSLCAMVMKNDWKFKPEKSGKMHMLNVQALCVYGCTHIQISK